MPSSRATAQAQTREKILDAAHEEFTSRRFVDVSLDAIAARAGFTKGAIYSNFDNKTDVLFSVLERHMESVGVDYSVATIHSTNDDLGAAVSRRAAAALENELGFFRLLIAVWGEALHNDEFAARFAKIRRDHRLRIADAIRTRADRNGITLPIDPVDLATGVIGMSMSSLMDGAIDPEVDVAKVHKAVIEMVLAGVLATAREREVDESG